MKYLKETRVDLTLFIFVKTHCIFSIISQKISRKKQCQTLLNYQAYISLKFLLRDGKNICPWMQRKFITHFNWVEFLIKGSDDDEEEDDCNREW